MDGRKKALTEVEACVCKDRAASYGTPENNFTNIATIINVVLQRKLREPVDAKDVALILASVKLARMVTSPLYRDNWIDLAGYAVCGAELTETKDAST